MKYLPIALALFLSTPALAFNCQFPMCVGPFDSPLAATEWLSYANKEIQMNNHPINDPAGGVDLMFELTGDGQCKNKGSVSECVCTSKSFPEAPGYCGATDVTAEGGTISKEIKP
jgi:hypothetical protein